MILKGKYFGVYAGKHVFGPHDIDYVAQIRLFGRLFSLRLTTPRLRLHMRTNVGEGQ